METGEPIFIFSVEPDFLVCCSVELLVLGCLRVELLEEVLDELIVIGIAAGMQDSGVLIVEYLAEVGAHSD